MGVEEDNSGQDIYRIFGSEMSPYSVKVRSFFRFKGIPHEWIVRSPANEDEFKQYAKLPLIPLVVTPDKEGMQDSTPIIEKLDLLYPEPGLQPTDPVLAFLSALIEEYADEWVNKHMFHYRWWRDEDKAAAAQRIAADNVPDGDAQTRAQVAQMVAERMGPRLSFVGSSEATKDLIEGSFLEMLGLVERHLEHRSYLFGERPCLADFGLFAQVYEASTDPTAGAIIAERGYHISRWVERMLTPPKPKGSAKFESYGELAPTLVPLLREEIAKRFLPWSAANARALEEGRESFSVELKGGTFSQAPQKYHARSLGVLRQKYASVESNDELAEILSHTGCLTYLKAA